MLTNADIIVQARSWLGTRFHHQGRLKKTTTHKGGVDCLGLLVGIASELKLRHTDGTLLSALDRSNYTHSPDTGYLQAKLNELLTPVALSDIAPGHILLLRIDNQPQHMAVVSDLEDGLGIIHAYAPARAVVEHALDDYWRGRIKQAYRFF